MIPAKEFDGELWIRAADIHLLNKHKGGTWVGLTDEEIDGLVKNTRWHELIKATESKLKQKNGFAEELNT